MGSNNMQPTILTYSPKYKCITVLNKGAEKDHMIGNAPQMNIDLDRLVIQDNCLRSVPCCVRHTYTSRKNYTQFPSNDSDPIEQMSRLTRVFSGRTFHIYVSFITIHLICIILDGVSPSVFRGSGTKYHTVTECNLAS